MKINRLLWGMIAALAVIVSGCDDDDEENLGVPSITASESSLSFSEDGGATNAQTITITSSRDWTASASEDWVIVSPTSGSAASGTTNVTVYVEANTSNDRTATITFATSTVSTTVSVSQSGPDGEVETGSGTKSDPYTVDGALAIINAGTYTSSNVYVKGIISQIDEIDISSYGNATYYISDDGETTSQLEVYRGYSLGGAKFTSEDEIEVGDTVIVYGELTLYSSTPEITQGSSIYYLNGVTSDVGYDDDYELEGSGTVDDPYTPADANYLCQSETYTSDYVYVKGIISTINEVSTSYGNANYYISADGTTTDEFYIYHGYGLGGAKFTSEDDIVVGDEVIVYGTLTLYYSTAEMAAYSSIYSLNGTTADVESGSDEDYTLVGSGTLDDPYTAADANYLCSSSTYTSDSVYVKGIISSITEVSPSYGNATYYISADGTTTDQFLIYRGYSLGGVKFTSEDEIKVGDEVIVYGVLILYNSSTAEMTTGSSIYSLNGVTYSEDSGDDSGDEEADDATYATVEKGTTTITITDPNATASSSSISYTFSDAGWSNGDETSTVTLSDGTTISFAQNTGNNAPKYYTSGTAVRMYALNSMTIAASSAIAKIELTCVSSYLGNDDLYATIDGNTWEVVNDHTSTSGGTQLRVVSITITYDGEAAEGGDEETEGDTYTLVGSGTESDPYSVADALYLINNSQIPSGNVCVKGIVTSVSSYNSNYGSLSYYIADTTDGETLYIYSGLGLSSAKFSSTDDLSAGDEVVVCGTLTTYNSTPEMNYNNYLISLNGSTSSDSGDDSGDEGGDAADEGITLSISDEIITLTDASATASATSVSIDFTAQELENQQDVTSTTFTLSDGATVTFAQGDGNNIPKYYTSSTSVRLYALNSMTVTGSKAIANIAITCAVYNGTTYTGNSGYVTASADGNAWTIVNGYTSASGGTQLRVVSLVITYAE